MALSMVHLLIALLGATCGVLLNWYVLIPIVTAIALASGVAGAINGYTFSDMLADTVLKVCVLEASWLASVCIIARMIQRRPDRPDRHVGRDRTPSERGS
ncbi:hypothetical protein [Methylobacterium sp. WL64]|uniref:hypothetical protein n=1 Tax=Methylobacterium sp. WL64 TaxID=2603894 RepID=UPI0011C809E1|nr:hypothetical protein [Methylobacterium sp. WL64]